MVAAKPNESNVKMDGCVKNPNFTLKMDGCCNKTLMPGAPKNVVIHIVFVAWHRKVNNSCKKV